MKKIKIIYFFIVALIFITANQSYAIGNNLNTGKNQSLGIDVENFSKLSKEEKIIIIKSMIIKVQEKIEKILKERKILNNIKYLEYKDIRNNDFIVKYPSLWKKESYTEENVFNVKFNPDLEDDIRMVVISTLKENISNRKDNSITKDDLLEMSRNAVNNYYTFFTNVDVVKNEEIIVDGKIARDIQVSYHDDLAMNTVYARQVAVIGKKKMILIDIKYQEDNKDKFEKIFDYMVKSFKVNN